MQSIPRLSISSLTKSISNSVRLLCIISHQLISTASESPPTPFLRSNDTIINSICDSLRKGLSFNTLSRRFNSVELGNSIIESVLLQLKEPVNAKRALGFFHWAARHRNFQHEVFSYCIIVHILAKAKLANDARALMESVLASVVSGKLDIFVVLDSLLSSYKTTDSVPFVFDLFMQTCSKLRMLDDALGICQYLDEHGFPLSLISYNTLLHVIQKSSQTHLVWKVYEHMIMKRVFPNEITTRVMVSALCKEGKLQKFVDLLDRIHGKRCSPNVIVNTCLLFQMMEGGRVEEGIVLLKRMLLKNMILDTISYSLIVFARVKIGELDSAREVYEEMLRRGLTVNSFLYTLFIGARCELGRIDEANGLLQEMENMGLKPYDESFNHLIIGCTKVGRLEQSLELCDKMIDIGLVPSCLAFNAIAQQLCKHGGTKRSDEMLTVLLEKGFVPNEITFSRLIEGYGIEGCAHGVLKLYYEMERQSFSPGSLAFSSLVVGLCKCGLLKEADHFLLVMKDRLLTTSVYVYEELIKSHLKNGNRERAHCLFHEMVEKGLNSH